MERKTSEMMGIEMIESGGVALVSSRVVANDFGKDHKDVLVKIKGKVRKDGRVEVGLIQGIEDAGEIPSNYFMESKWKDSYDREQVEYLLTRDGFSLLVMGFTGKEALQWKLKYIEAFNKMEEYIKQHTPQIKPDSYMIEDPIERAKRWIEEEEVRRQLELDNQEKQKLIEKQEERIQEQETEIVHKEDVIISLTQDVSIAEKRQRINDIVRYGAKGRYSERWSLLYKEFDSKFHINTKVRLERAKERGEVLKSTTRMDYICDVLNLTNELFDLCTVVFEADYIDMLENYLSVAKRNK